MQHKDFRKALYQLFSCINYLLAARLSVMTCHINSITSSILFTIWLVRMILDVGLPYPVVILEHYWQR